MHQVVGERVVIIENQYFAHLFISFSHVLHFLSHALFSTVQFFQELYSAVALSIAFFSAPSLLFTSCSSYASSLLETMPAPAWYHSSLLRLTNVRMVIAWLMFPFSPTKPMHPPYAPDRKSTRLNSSHVRISYAVFCLKKKKKT